MSRCFPILIICVGLSAPTEAAPLTFSATG